jgi:hypothetical protein
MRYCFVHKACLAFFIFLSSSFSHSFTSLLLCIKSSCKAQCERASSLLSTSIYHLIWKFSLVCFLEEKCTFALFFFFHIRVQGCMCWMTGWLGRKRGTWICMERNYVGEGNIGQLRLQFVAMIGHIYDTHTHVI